MILKREMNKKTHIKNKIMNKDMHIKKYKSNILLSILMLICIINTAQSVTVNIYVKSTRIVTYDAQIPGTSDYLDIRDPVDIFVDANGNIYIIDGEVYAVFVLNSSGSLLRRFGTYGAGNSQFTNPTGIAVDSAGNIYVADDIGDNTKIVKFDNSGNYINNVTGTAGVHTAPGGLGYALNPGGSSSEYILCIEQATDDIFAISTNLTVFDTWSQADIQNPEDIHYDPVSDCMYITSLDDNFRRLSWSNFINNNAVDDTAAQGANYNSSGLIMKDGDCLFISPVNTTPDTIRRYSPGSAINNISDMASDQDGNIYVVDNNLDRVIVYNSNGYFLREWGSTGIADGQFTTPYCIAVDPA